MVYQRIMRIADGIAVGHDDDVFALEVVEQRRLVLLEFMKMV